MRWVLVVKTIIYYVYYYFYGLLSQNESTNRRTCSEQAMQSTGGDHHRTNTSHTYPLTIRMPVSPCRPSPRAWPQKQGGIEFMVAILEVWGVRSLLLV
jgi:hypothetical protein